MNELTNQIRQIMVPKAALIAYECRNNNYSCSQNYLELHPINEKGRMGAGIPVTYDFMNSLVESYTESMNGIPHGRVPSNMLWCDTRKGHERYVWYNPPQKRKMYFKESLNIPDGSFNVPGVIYVVERGHMNIHAFKGKAPEEKTELYLAPFFNVTDSSVCLGNSSLEKPQDMDFHGLQEYWEKRFWLSEFSHLGGSRNPTRNNLVSVTEQARNHPFDYSELQSSGLQLKDILQ
ncbi:prokaryotic E2 ligase family D protein [Phocaeicola sp.]